MINQELELGMICVLHGRSVINEVSFKGKIFLGLLLYIYMDFQISGKIFSVKSWCQISGKIFIQFESLCMLKHELKFHLYLIKMKEGVKFVFIKIIMSKLGC
jgi:hypothetical protein